MSDTDIMQIRNKPGNQFQNLLLFVSGSKQDKVTVFEFIKDVCLRNFVDVVIGGVEEGVTGTE